MKSEKTQKKGRKISNRTEEKRDKEVEEDKDNKKVTKNLTFAK